MGIKVEQVAVRRSIKRALVWLGFSLAFLALACGDSWVAESPLFNLVGSIACFVFLLLCWATGSLWWLIRGSKEVCVWAHNLMPFCVQPYRSIASIPVLFIVIRLSCDKWLWVCNCLPWFGKHWQVFLAVIRWGLWLLFVTAWFAATCLTVVRFIDSGRIASIGLDVKTVQENARIAEQVQGSKRVENVMDASEPSRGREVSRRRSKEQLRVSVEPARYLYGSGSRYKKTDRQFTRA